MTRNQIKKRQAVVSRRWFDIFRQSGPSEKAEAEVLRKELEDLESKWNESSDADEPTQEIYFPASITERAPLVVLLHGAGWTGGSQVEIWEPVAEREKIALLAPTSLSEERDWTHRNDDQVLAVKIDSAVRTMGVDTSRIYLVGHSLGGKLALRMGLLHPNLFAAVALHSPTTDHEVRRVAFRQSSRRLPVRVWAGSDYERDCNRTWAEVLEMHFREHLELGVDLDIKLLDRHNHSDYNIREGLFDEIWTFLKNKLNEGRQIS